MLGRITYPVFNRPAVQQRPVLRFQGESLSNHDRSLAKLHHFKNAIYGLTTVLENMGEMIYSGPQEERTAFQSAFSFLQPLKTQWPECDELLKGCQRLSDLLEKSKSQEGLEQQERENKASLMGGLWLKSCAVQDNAVKLLQDLKAKQASESGAPYDSGQEMDIHIQSMLDALSRSYHHYPNIQWDYDPVVVHTDPELLEMALVNLIDNALNHCPKGTPIRVSVKRPPWKRDQIRFTVSDAGLGIPQELRRLLFSRHKSKHSDPKKQYNTRVGLYITRQLVKAMQGKLTVRSEPGKGTTISFSIPLAKPA